MKGLAKEVVFLKYLRAARELICAIYLQLSIHLCFYVDVNGRICHRYFRNSQFLHLICCSLNIRKVFDFEPLLYPGPIMSGTYEIYRCSTLGDALADALDELVNEQQLTPALAMRVLVQFDKSMYTLLAQGLRNRGNIKVDVFSSCICIGLA